MRTSSPIGEMSEGSSLRKAAAELFPIGCALMSDHLSEPGHAELVARHFDVITPENEFKPAEVQREPGRFDYRAADKIVRFGVVLQRLQH